jgi:diguanylate cyclase (GGDEF)-like protein
LLRVPYGNEQLTTINTREVLAQLIELTSQRDSNTLEISLAHALFDLVAPGAVLIYRATNPEQTRFNSTLVTGGSGRDQISEALQDELCQCIQSSVHRSFSSEDGHESTLLYPLKGAKNQPLAVIAVVVPEDAPDFYEVTEMLLQIYHNFIGLMHDNERDTLTGLLNRKTFEHKINKVFSEMLSRHTRKADKSEPKYFLAIFDIDHFKRVNDDYGHLMGDEVLLLFSQLMTKTFREMDLLFRFGGEEFVAVFECPNVDDIQRVLDRFREKVGAFGFPQVGKVTVSSGYTELNPHETSAQLIDRADVALYFAKNNGRNRVCNYEQLVANGDLQENKKEGDIELF